MIKKTRHQLMCHHTDEVLFEGWFITIKDCVEQAVKDHVNLDGVNLQGMNLSCANLDDAQMAGANLNKTNLNGTNLSEGIFDNATFIGADLSHACLALSSFMNVDMTCASFGATDVTNAVISGCQFSCPSVFSTSFCRTAVFGNCTFIHDKKGACVMTQPPIIIYGLPRDVVYMDHVIKIGNDFVHKGDLIAAGDTHLAFIYGREVANFYNPFYMTRSSHFIESCPWGQYSLNLAQACLCPSHDCGLILTN